MGLFQFFAKLRSHQESTHDSAKERALPGGLFEKGDVIGSRYEVFGILGRGGFGIVYLVYDRHLGEACALKTFRDEFLSDTPAREAFRNEALLWVNLEIHPFILRASMVNKISGRLFVRMDYVAPDSLGRVSLADHLACAREPIDENQALKWAIQFCHGMEYANFRGIKCHRDIKPANILIMQDGTLKITDFGLAAAAQATYQGAEIDMTLRQGRESSLSVFQSEGKRICGTPGYIAPEILRGNGANVQSDIYSFGSVLWQMAAGSPVPPFHAHNEKDLSKYIRLVYNRQISGLIPPVKSPMWSVIERCLAVDPADRYLAFKDVREDLDRIFIKRTGKRIQVPDVDEQNAAFWNEKGLALAALDYFEKAIDYYDKALSLDSLYLYAWHNKGGGFFNLRLFDRAIECYDRVLKIDPQHLYTLHDKGVVLSQLGVYATAIEYYDKALQVNPRDLYVAHILTDKGVALAAIGKHKEAIECHDEALVIDPRFSYAWHFKGHALAGLGDFEEATKCYHKALEIDPKYVDAWTHQGEALGNLGRLWESIECFDQALEIDPKNLFATSTWHNKGGAFYKLGNLEKAIECYDEALEIDPNKATSLYYKAQAQEELGRYGDAIQSYREFLKHALPDHGSLILSAQRQLNMLTDG